MIKGIENIAGGLAGAAVLNILHETVKRLDADAPRVDLVGEEALSKSLESIGVEPPKGDALFGATLVADIFSNALYFSAVGTGKKKNLLLLGAGYDLAAGIGAITLTKPLGLDDRPINRTAKTKALTVAFYLVGGLVSALTIKGLRKKTTRFI